MSRHWCWTAHAWESETPDDLAFRLGACVALAELSEEIRYAIFSVERGEGGCLHAQGYAQFYTPHRMSALKRILDDGTVHCEPSAGSLEENQQYCSKEESHILGPFEYGTATTMGGRTDLEAIGTAVNAGIAADEIREAFPSSYIRYRSGIIGAIGDASVARALSKTPTVFVLWGPTGTGKSFAAREYCREVGLKYYVFTPSPTGVWWDGYHGHPVVIFDDYGGEIPYRQLLQILDRYEYTAWIKGGSVQLQAHTFFFTSNVRLEQWYPMERAEALARRITFTFFLDGRDVPHE